MNKSIQPAPRTVSKTRGRIFWALLTVAAVLAVFAAAMLLFPRALNPDRVVRFFRYMGLRDKESYGSLSFEGGAGNVCAGFDDGLLAGTESGLALYSLDGEQKALIQGSLPTPVLRVGEEVSLLFSPGSSYAAAVGKGGKVLMDGALSGAFVNADVSQDGYIAYITAESGYKSVATVLNPRQEPMFRFSSRTRYLNACAVSEGGEYLAVARLEESEGLYRSGVAIFRTDTEVADLEQESGSTVRADLGGQVVYELRFLDRTHLLAIAQDELIFLNAEGEVLASHSMLDGTLTDWCVSGDGWLIAAFEQNGGCRVLTLNAAGEVLGELDLTERVRSVSAAGSYAAILTETWLQTYDRRLNAYDRSRDVLGAARVIARSDGTALLIASGGTKLFIP